MSVITKKAIKDETRLGDCAAKQPLSGTNVVTMVRVKGGFNSANFCSPVETALKKAV